MSAPDAKEPALLSRDRGEAHEVDARGPLFAGGEPKGTDVEQNTLGDCFFLAPLASFAERRPGEVKAAIHDRGDGTFTVRLFHEDPETGALLPREVAVDGRIPEENGRPIYGTTVGRRGRWVAIFEKAFAVLRGGYSRIDGGDVRAAVRALTGHPARTASLDLARGDAIWETLEHAFASRRIAVTSTATDTSARTKLAHWQARGKAAAHGYDAATFTYGRRGLLPDHVYSVWGLSGAAGDRSVALRNPWADREPPGNGKDDGLFTLPFDELLAIFTDVTVEE